MKFFFKWLLLFVFVIIISIITLNVLIYRQPYEKRLDVIEHESEFMSLGVTSRGTIENDELTSKHNMNLGARLREFCNLPFQAMHGTEGNVSTRMYKLEGVFVVARHGHRAPIFSPGNAHTSVQCDLNEAAIRRIGYLPLERFARRIQNELRDTLKRMRVLSALRQAPNATPPNEAELLESVYNDAYYANMWNFFNLRGAQCTSGQLSLFGVAQFLELGRYFRRVYIDRWGLVPSAIGSRRHQSTNTSTTVSLAPDYQSTTTSSHVSQPDLLQQPESTPQPQLQQQPSVSSEPNYYRVLLKTTKSQRTQLSGIALMYAFLDLDHFSFEKAHAQLSVTDFESYTRMQLPFFTKRISFMNFCDEPSQRWLPSGIACTCPAISPLAKKIYQHTTRLQLELNAVRNARTALFDFVPNRERAGPLWILDLIDHFVPDACFALQLPCVNVSANGQHSEQHCMKAAHLEALLSASQLVGLSVNQLDEHKHYSSVYIYPLLSEIAVRMRALASNVTMTDEESARFTLYSGHDYTVSYLMQALGVHRGGWPNFAARVVFELYSIQQSASSSSQSTTADTAPTLYFVRVLVNGLDVTQELEACFAHTNADGLCDLDAFERFVMTESIVKYAHAPTFADACRKPVPVWP